MFVEQRVSLRRFSEREAVRDEVRGPHLLKHLPCDLQAARLAPATLAFVRDGAYLTADEPNAAAVETSAQIHTDAVLPVPRADDNPAIRAGHLDGLIQRRGG